MVLRFCDKCCTEIVSSYAEVSISGKFISGKYILCGECCDALVDELRPSAEKFEQIEKRRSVPDAIQF